jgi:pimeloyl-ACP methyl ester carboxylesterase
MTMTPFTPVLRTWERHFTVVQWDRRGAGRTLAKNGRADSDRLTFAQMAADGIEVAEHLRRRLNVEKLVLVGHSQGTIVGVLMARQRPDLFTAYVGTGQITDMARNEPASYQLAIERAQATGNAKALRNLTSIGAPPWPSARTWLIKQRWSFVTDRELRAWGKKSTPMVLTAPNRSLRDVYLFNQAFTIFPQPLYEETIAWDSAKHGTQFDLPVFLFHGASDEHTLTSLASEYFDIIEAPAKGLVLIPDGGHCAVLAQPDVFLTHLLAHLAPLAEPAEGDRRF